MLVFVIKYSSRPTLLVVTRGNMRFVEAIFIQLFAFMVVTERMPNGL